jgi:ribonuclease HII
VTLIETNAQGIQWLFEDAYQDIPCEACYKLMGVRPTLVAMFTDPLSIWIVYGSNVDKAGEETLNKIFRGKTSIEPIILPSHDHLRQEVAARIKHRLNKLNELLEIKDATYLAEHWKDFPPSIFAAAAVALTSPVPGVQFGVRQDDEGNLPSTDELLASIGLWQAKIWCGLCLWWFPDRERLTTLEEDLQEVIDPAFILPGALETFISFVDKMQNSKDILPISRYILEAIRASLYANVGLPNPEADFWALAFFDYELFNRRNESNLPVKYRTTVISEERARKTISFRSAWNAVIELRREIDALVDKNMQLSLMEYLQQIAEKAGHPDLLYQMMQQGEVIGADQELPLDAFIQAMQQAIEKLGQEDVPLVAFSSIARYLVSDRRIADLEKFSVALIEALGGGYDNQARVEAWLGRYLKEAREPYRLINRIGAQPRVWEYSIDKSKRVALWTERSNALRLMDRKD